MFTWIDVRMAETSYVGLHRFCNMSRQIPPSAYTANKSTYDMLINETVVVKRANLIVILTVNCTNTYRLDGTSSRRNEQWAAYSDTLR